jgi:hypothetical protein
MKIDEFKNFDMAGRSARVKVFESIPPSPPAKESEIAALESSIGVKISSSFREFLMAFGGGNYGLSVIFCADDASEWYLPRQMQEVGAYLPVNFLPISNDFTGGIYCQKIENKQATDKIWYWNTDGGLTETECLDVFDLVSKTAY